MLRAATHKLTLMMGDSLCSRHRMEVLLPHAFINIHNAIGMGEVKCGKMPSAPGHVNFFTPGQSRAAPALALIFVGSL